MILVLLMKDMHSEFQINERFLISYVSDVCGKFLWSSFSRKHLPAPAEVKTPSSIKARRRHPSRKWTVENQIYTLELYSVFVEKNVLNDKRRKCKTKDAVLISEWCFNAYKAIFKITQMSESHAFRTKTWICWTQAPCAFTFGLHSVHYQWFKKWNL